MPAMTIAGLPNGITINRVPTDPWNNDISTRDTIQVMKRMALEGSNDPYIVGIANECYRGYSSGIHKVGDHLRNLVRCAYVWVKGHVTFMEDEDVAHNLLGMSYEDMQTPEGALDLIMSPSTLVRMQNPVGDCDCFSTLLASILISLGFKVWFKAIKVDPNEPDRWSHVYLITYLPDEDVYLPLDASHGPTIGWEKKDGVFGSETWEIN